eukprot:IDg16313t1
MAVLNGLPANYESTITALDAVGDDDYLFPLYKFYSRLLQEEKRRSILHGLQAITR